MSDNSFRSRFFRSHITHSPSPTSPTSIRTFRPSSLLSLTRSRPFQQSSRRRDSLFWHSDLSCHFDGHLRGSALPIPCSDVLVTDFAIVGVVEKGISSITEYLGVFLFLHMYIFYLREPNNQTICCTPHSKRFKSSVLVFVLNCVPSSVSIAISSLFPHCDLVLGFYCDLVLDTQQYLLPP